MRPLSTRSLVLSVLLGSHPPRSTLSALVDFCELFDVRPGTVRTTLSRMVTSGELVASTRPNGAAAYEVTGELLERQRQQDVGRARIDQPWDGRWITAIVLAESRPVAERRRFRSRMLGAKFGELRPEVWMRPANLPPPSGDDRLIVMSGPLDGPDAGELAARLWDLPDLESRGRALLDALEGLRAADLAPTFLVLAATLNHLRIEPQLPTELVPTAVGDELRAAYASCEARFREALADFLRARR